MIKDFSVVYFYLFSSILVSYYLQVSFHSQNTVTVQDGKDPLLMRNTVFFVLQPKVNGVHKVPYIYLQLF